LLLLHRFNTSVRVVGADERKEKAPCLGQYEVKYSQIVTIFIKYLECLE